MSTENNQPAQVEQLDADLVKANLKIDRHPNLAGASDYAIQVADDTYNMLRAGIAHEIEVALANNTTLVHYRPQQTTGKIAYGPIDLSDFIAHLPDDTQAHYKCDYCNQVWAHIAGLAVLNEDGTVESLVLRAFETLSARFSEVSQAENHREWAALRTIKNILHNKRDWKFDRTQSGVRPVVWLNESLLAKREVGGFSHFYGVEKIDTVRLWNAQRAPFTDYEYVTTLYQKLIDPSLNLETLSKLFVYIVANIGERDETALGYQTDLLQLMQQLREVRKTSDKALLLLWSKLSLKKNAWLRHLNKSVLSIVIDAALELKDTSDYTKVLERTRALMKSATAPENHKNKTAEANIQEVESAFRMLEEHGLQNSLLRRIPKWTEAKTIAWQPAGKQAETEKSVLSVADAFDALRVAKDPLAKANNALDAALDNTVRQSSISVQAFVACLSEFESIELDVYSLEMFPFLVTAAATEDEKNSLLLKFDTAVHPSALVLSTPQRYSYQVVRSFCGLPQHSGQRNIPGLGLVQCSDNPQLANYVLILEGFASGFYDLMKRYGTAVLGTMYTPEYYGHARALTEVSKKLTMQNADDPLGFGGITLGPGVTLLVKNKAGYWERITIVTYK